VSYKIPPKSTQGSKLEIVARGPARVQARTLQEAANLRFWAERFFFEQDFLASGYDAGEMALEPPSLRDKFFGLAVIVGVSGAFWTGVGLLINHLLR